MSETLSLKQINAVCDKWAALFKIGSWNFSVELKDDGPTQFRYNCQNGTVVLEILYAEATEKTIVYMLTDYALLHSLLPRLKESGDQYIDHDDRNIHEIADLILTLSKSTNLSLTLANQSGDNIE